MSDDDTKAMDMSEILDFLSPEARAALQDHLAQKEKKSEVSEDIGEDFGMSQFWYDERTSNLLAKEAISLGADANGQVVAAGTKKRIACVSCPSVFKAIKAINPPDCEFFVFEYDRRFGVYGDQYVYYDFNRPYDVPQHLHHTFDFVMADPPYLNEDCMAQTGETMRLLAKNYQTPCVFNTGLVLEHAIRSILGMRPCVFAPVHSCKLSNQFASYSNYANPQSKLGGWLADDSSQPPITEASAPETPLSYRRGKPLPQIEALSSRSVAAAPVSKIEVKEVVMDTELVGKTGKAKKNAKRREKALIQKQKQQKSAGL